MFYEAKIKDIALKTIAEDYARRVRLNWEYSLQASAIEPLP